MKVFKIYLKKIIPYRIFLRVLIYSYYNVFLILQINTKYKYFSKRKNKSLHKNGFMQCAFNKSSNLVMSTGFDDFCKRINKIIKEEKNLKRVIYTSKDMLNNSFFKNFIKNSLIIDVCDDYFKFDYFLGCAEVWWGRPNYQNSGYSLYHRDRNTLNALHFDINLKDMYEGSGAVEVINKQQSRKIKNLWGGEMIKDIKLLYQFFSENKLKKSLHHAYGKKGTIFCYDSMTNFHRGGICKNSDRLILHICFYENVFWRKESYPIRMPINKLINM
ncbi:MAG: hypothetical protein CMP36_03035 [Rickettsiales bacterium]|nr:hypothetical protein [Rickettsiales bacterium]